MKSPGTFASLESYSITYHQLCRHPAFHNISLLRSSARSCQQTFKCRISITFADRLASLVEKQRCCLSQGSLPFILSILLSGLLKIGRGE